MLGVCSNRGRPSVGQVRSPMIVGGTECQIAQISRGACPVTGVNVVGRVVDGGVS